MKFLTIFTAPKSFTDPHIAIIQRNAILSWMHLSDEVEVLIIGGEAGIAEAAKEIGVKHLPEVRLNEWGTPLVSSIFELARQNSQAALLAYINADILVLPDFLEAAHHVEAQCERFLILGQRWDLTISQEIVFKPGWDVLLREKTLRRGKLHPPAGSDYFIFPRQLLTEMPDFAIGRAGWDNWTIYHARRLGWEVVSATPSVMVVHQNHNYNHLPGGQPHYDLEESRLNAILGGGPATMYTILEANNILVEGRLHHARPSLIRVLRQIELRLVNNQQRGVRWFMLRRVRRLRRKLVGTLVGNAPDFV